MPTKLTYAQMQDMNQWLRESSDVFYFQCTTRTVQESKLFPVNPYIALSYYNCWYRYPELLRKISDAMSPEELGDRAREVSTSANAIMLGIIQQFYLGGRQYLLDMGLINATDGLEDMHFVLDFAQRVNRSYHRQSSYNLNSAMNHRSQLLPERTLQVFEADALGCKPGDKLHQAVVKYLATASQYAFLKNCECRLGIHNSGPYKVGNNEMLVRDFVDLAEGDYPWMDGVASEIEYNNVTLPVIMKDTHFNIVDDWGSFEATPAYDHDNMVAVGLYTSDYLSNGYIPVHMNNASELADYLDHMRDQMQVATANLWKRISGWTRDQMIDAGLLVYYSVAKDLAHFAGVYSEEDWFTVEDRVQRLKPIMNDEYGGMAIAELVGYVSLSSQQGSPYTMSKFSNAPGDMWSAVPYSPLANDEFTAGVGPIRGGSTSLPRKTAKYTTTRGKLTADEANALARGFTPPIIEGPRRFYDDQWVKYHVGTPEADDLYRRAQENSIQLKGKGSGLNAADIEALRRW
ncbi:unannotated protein [freshwater metagenome]|uniref:Unannotated protein n=1 Tax=freshwater metagenome TaxID=449393 RepID=A0A6J7IPT3_9ZZZZ|nr:hypothetical protein [Actinomycetota bacterium]